MSLPTARPRPLIAKYPSTCRLCGDKIEPESASVYWANEPRGAKLAHAECYRKAAGNGADVAGATSAAELAGAAAVNSAAVAPTVAVPVSADVAELARHAGREAAREWLKDGSATIQSNVAQQLRATADKLRDEILAGMAVRVTVENSTGAVVDVGMQHRGFPELVQFASARMADGSHPNVFLVGPAGSGKTTAARALATSLGLPFAFNGAIDTEYKLLGFVDAMGRVVSRPFRDIWTNGGVYLFDEIDGSLAPALLAFNAPLANGYCDFPDACVKRHPDCIIIAAGNTWGNGATAKFIGRNKLDGASMDRFIRTEWPIDEALESALVPADVPGAADWCKRVQRIRAAIYKQGLEIVCSPRATFHGVALLRAGVKVDRIAAVTVFAGLSAEQRKIVDVA